MRLLAFSSKNFRRELASFCREASVPQEITDRVSSILDDIRKRGDEAVSDYAAKFDGARLRARDFPVKPAELERAAQRVPATVRKALAAAHRSVVAYNRRGRPRDWRARNPHGARVGEIFHPIRRVGIYVPGGEVPLVSTVLMTATLARLARCPETVVFTPSNAEGRVPDALLAALHRVGVDEVYRIGGVQAIGAMAFGTATIRPVDKIFGPGNAYVCEAKRQVFGAVGIDSLPGPSEVMVIADETASPGFAAADLLAQAEHGSGREKIYLVALSRPVLDAVVREVDRQLPHLARSAKARRVIEEGFLAVEVRSPAEAAIVANEVAPEHLELMVASAVARSLQKSVTTAGAIMIGNQTPTALGDFVAGPSHVLPTGGAGRFFSGLRVADFLRRTSIIEYDSRAVKRAEPTVAAFAAMEQLEGHGRSVRLRLE